MILPILSYGAPVLRKEGEDFDENTSLVEFIDNMFENKEIDDELLALKDFKKVFINPIIEKESGDLWSFSEGCLSIPGIREEVERKSAIKISYYDENWNLKEESYDGIAARIIQHEYDHIEGILFTDHLNPLKRRLLKRKLEDISKGKVEVNYKMKFQNLKK